MGFDLWPSTLFTLCGVCFLINSSFWGTLGCRELMLKTSFWIKMAWGVGKLWSRTQQSSAMADGSIYFHLRNSESRACPRHLSLHSESNVYGQLQGVTHKRLKQGGEKKSHFSRPTQPLGFSAEGQAQFHPNRPVKTEPKQLSGSQKPERRKRWW